MRELVSIKEEKLPVISLAWERLGEGSRLLAKKRAHTRNLMGQHFDLDSHTPHNYEKQISLFKVCGAGN